MPQQKIGDVCENCRHFWEGQNPPQEPKVLQLLGKTENKKTPVPACPHCDGGALDIRSS